MMNYMNPFNYKSSSNETKEIKSSFMPKINREPKDNKFKKLSKYLTQNLFRYFNYKEIYEFGKTNVFFMNNLIEYLENNENLPEKVRKLKCKYNFKIYQNEVDQTLNQAKINKRTIIKKEYEGNIFMNLTNKIKELYESIYFNIKNRLLNYDISSLDILK